MEVPRVIRALRERARASAWCTTMRNPIPAVARSINFALCATRIMRQLLRFQRASHLDCTFEKLSWIFF